MDKKIQDFFEKHPWLTGESEIKRAFAIMGYYLIAWLVIYGVLFGISLIVIIVTAITS